MLRTLTFDKGLRLFNRALSLNGTRIGVTCAEIDLSAGCQKPPTIEYVGRRERFMLKHHEVAPRWNDPTTWESVSVIIHAKCRNCEACLEKRRIHWYFRAKFELSVAPRSWFGTMTYAPEQIARRQILAERKAASKGLDWGSLSDDEKFKCLTSVCGRDITLYLKRLRKGARGAIRYLLVCEKHQSGLPHWHVFIHERSRNAVTHRLLKRCWIAEKPASGNPDLPRKRDRSVSLGFTDFKLVDDEKRAAGYASKYISKDAVARVRASGKYGEKSAFSVSLGIGERSATAIAGA